jgi:hypothetical protein
VQARILHLVANIGHGMVMKCSDQANVPITADAAERISDRSEVIDVEGTEKPASNLPICIVIDTNIWRSEVLLRTARGAALLYYIKQSQSMLGMPEVIEREIVKHAVLAGKELQDGIEANYRMLTLLTGSTPGYKVSTLEEIEAKAKERLDELKSLIVPVEFTLEHARAALDRVNSGLPPNGPKNQQFKDSAIWEAVMELAHMYRVYFLTNDKAFYKDPEKPTRGLAENLAEECKSCNADIRLYRDIAAGLADLQKHAAPLDTSELAVAIEATIVATSLEKSASDRGYSLTGERLAEAISAFATEKLDTVALTFELTYRLVDQSTDESSPRLEGTLTAKGNCYFNTDKDEISNVMMNAEIFKWKDAKGAEFSNSNAYAYGTAALVVGGMRSVPHTLREPVGYPAT